MIRIVLAGTWAYLKPTLALRIHAILGGILPETPLNIVGARCRVRINLARALGGLNKLDRFDFLLDHGIIRIVKPWPWDIGKAVRLLPRFDRILEAALS
jgi:hypothetical protein